MAIFVVVFFLADLLSYRSGVYMVSSLRRGFDVGVGVVTSVELVGRLVGAHSTNPRL